MRTSDNLGQQSLEAGHIAAPGLPVSRTRRKSAFSETAYQVGGMRPMYSSLIHSLIFGPSTFASE